MAKKTTEKPKGAVLDFLDNELDSLEKDYGLDAGSDTDNQWRISFGLLALDLLTKGGAKPGGWYTFFGGEQSTKTTLATYAAGHAAADGNVPLMAWWDYEGSSDPEYFTNMMRIARPSLKVEEVFGVQGRKGWVVRPKVRLYQEAVGETFFDWLHTVLSALPDKRHFDGSWWEVFEDTKESRKLLGAKFDTTLSKERGGLWVPTDNGHAQGLVIVDSYPAMLPKNADQTDKGGGMALQARMFSEQLKKVKGRMGPKRMTVMGINQLRQKPGVLYGCYHASVKVTMADGSQYPIKEVVEKRMEGPVMAYNPSTKRFEPKRITAWFNNGPAKKWLRITYAVPKTKKGPREASIVVTPDHMMWHGDYETLVKAKRLKVGDSLVAPSHRVLSEHARQLYMGMMFGDGYFQEDSDYVQMSFAHKADHQWLVDWKHSLLPKGGVSGSSVVECAVPFVYDPDLAEMVRARKKGCAGRQKRVCSKILSQIDLVGLAVWYMDDASKNSGIIKMQSYPMKDVRKVCTHLNTKYGAGCSVKTWKDSARDDGVGYGIQLDHKILTLIAPYVHKNFAEGYGHLSYTKLFGQFKGWVPSGTDGSLPVKIVEIEEIDKPRYLRQCNYGGTHVAYSDADRYEIEVEDLGLFVADGIVAKNSPEYESGGEALKFFCPTGDQHVLTESGLQRVDELYEEDNGSRRLVMGPYGWQVLKGIKKAGEAPIWKVTVNSFTFKGKAGHKVLAIYFKNGRLKYGFRAIEKLNPGDLVAMSRPPALQQYASENKSLYEKLQSSRPGDPGYNALRWATGLFEPKGVALPSEQDVLLGRADHLLREGSPENYQKLAMAYPRLFASATIPLFRLTDNHIMGGIHDVARDTWQDQFQLSKKARRICNDTMGQSLIWHWVDKVEEVGREMTYDLCTPATGTYLCEGIVTHNSDVRIRMASRQFPGATLKQGMEYEEAIDGGTDTYRYVMMRTAKNKLGGIPNSETWARVWVADSRGVARGYCPVFDAYMFLKMTGSVSGTKNRMKVDLPEFNNGEHKPLSWLQLKKLVLGDKQQIKDTCVEIGVKPFHLRKALTKYLKDGSAFDWYTDNTQGRQETSDDE